MAYSELEDLKGYLAITDNSADDALTAMLQAAINYIEDYTNRNFSGRAKRIEDEEHLACELRYKLGEYCVRIDRDDLQGVNGITIVRANGDEVVVDAMKYRFIKSINTIYFKALLFDTDIVKVSYSYGTTSTPDIINQIILAYARLLANQSEDDTIANAFVQSARVGEASVSFSASVDNLSSSQQVLDSQSKIDRQLDFYRKRHPQGV